MKRISREFLNLRRDLQILFLEGNLKFKEGAGTLMTPCATSYLPKKVCLIIWVHKDLENSIVEFTLYLNSCVCVQKVMSLKTKVIHQMFWQKQILFTYFW